MSFKRHPYLKSNTTVNIHSAPYITGTERKDSSQQFPNNMDSANFLATVDAEFRWAVEQEDGTVTEYEIMGVGSGVTPILTLDELIAAINAEQTNSNSPVLASEVEGSLRLTLQIISNSNPEKAIRILPAASYSEYIGNGTGVDLSYTLGFQRYPHPNGVVTRGEVFPTAHRPNSQQNEPLSTFLAVGEDRLSENINRALYSIGKNLDDADTRLRNKVAVPTQLILNRTSSRLIYNTEGYVTHIDLSTSVGDSYDTLLSNRRVFIYNFEDSSFFVAPENKHFAITDKNGRSISSWRLNNTNLISHDVDIVSVGHIKENLSPTYPNITASNADKVLQASTGISSISSNTVIRCDSADFSNVKTGDKAVISGSATLPYSNDGEYIVGQVISNTELEVLPINSTTQEILNLTTPLGNVTISTGSHWRRNIRLELSPTIPRIPLTVRTNTEQRDALEDDDAIILHLYLEYDLGEGEVEQHVIPSASDRPEIDTPVNFSSVYLGENERYVDAGGVLAISRRALSLLDDGWRASTVSSHNKTPNISADALDHDFDSSLFGTNVYQGAEILSSNILKMPYNGTTIHDSPQFSKNLVGSYIRFDNTSFTPGALSAAGWSDVPLECRLALITEFIDSAHVRVRAIGAASNFTYPIGAINFFDLLINYSPEYTPSSLELKSVSEKIAITIVGDEERNNFGITDAFVGADAANTVTDDPSTPILCLKRLNISNTQGMWGTNTSTGSRAWVRNVKMRTDAVDSGWIYAQPGSANFITSGVLRSWDLIDGTEIETSDGIKQYLGDSNLLSSTNTSAFNVPGTVVRIVSNIQTTPTIIKDGFYRIIDIEQERIRLGDLLTGSPLNTSTEAIEVYCSFYSISFAVGLFNQAEKVSRGIHSFVDFSSLKSKSSLTGTPEQLPSMGGSVYSLDWRGHGAGLYASLNTGSTLDPDILSYSTTATNGVGDVTSGYFIQGEIRGPAAGIKLNTLATRGVDYRNYSPGIDVYSQTFSTDYQEASRSFSGAGKFASYTARFQQTGCDPNVVMVSGTVNEESIYRNIPGANLLVLSNPNVLNTTSGLWSNSSLYISAEAENLNFTDSVPNSSTNGLIAMDADSVLRTGTKVLPASGVRTSQLGSSDIYRYFKIGATSGKEQICQVATVSDADYTGDFKNVKHSYIVYLELTNTGSSPRLSELKSNIDKSVIGLKIGYEGTNISSQALSPHSNTFAPDSYDLNYDMDTIVGISVYPQANSTYRVYLACLAINSSGVPTLPSSIQITDLYIYANRYRKMSADISDGTLIGTWSYRSAGAGENTYRNLKHPFGNTIGSTLKEWSNSSTSILDTSYAHYPLISRLDWTGLYYGEKYESSSGSFGNEGGHGYIWYDSSLLGANAFGNLFYNEDITERFISLNPEPIIKGVSSNSVDVYPNLAGTEGPIFNSPTLSAQGPHSEYKRWAFTDFSQSTWEDQQKINDQYQHPDTEVNRLITKYELSSKTPGGYSEFSFEDTIIHPINTYTETTPNNTLSKKSMSNTTTAGACVIPDRNSLEADLNWIAWGDPYTDTYWLEMPGTRSDGQDNFTWSSFTPANYSSTFPNASGPFNPYVDASYDAQHKAMRIGIHCDHEQDYSWEVTFCKWGPKVFSNLNHNFKLQLQIGVHKPIFINGLVKIKPCLYYRTANYEEGELTKGNYSGNKLIWEHNQWENITNVPTNSGPDMWRSLSFDITKGALDSIIQDGDLSSSFHTSGRIIMALKIQFDGSNINTFTTNNREYTNFLSLRIFELINQAYPMVIDGNVTVTGSLSAASIGLNQLKKGSQAVGPMDVSLYSGADISEWDANPLSPIEGFGNEGSRPYPQGYGRLRDITGSWIKPVYEGSDFFKQGVQGAVINMVHPYHDPAYYMWVAKNIEFFQQDTVGDYGGSQGNSFSGLFNFHNLNASNYRNVEQPIHELTYIAPRIDAANDTNSADWSKNLILPGPTGFTIPLDPPHGARLTSMSWNIFNGVGHNGNNQSTNLNSNNSRYCYGAYYAAMPSESTTRPIFEQPWGTRDWGHEWAKSNHWEPCVGFRVNLYRFNLMGDEEHRATISETRDGTDHSFTPRDQGGPELIWTTISTLKEGEKPYINRDANNVVRSAGVNMRGTCKFYNYDTSDNVESRNSRTTNQTGSGNNNTSWNSNQEFYPAAGRPRINDAGGNNNVEDDYRNKDSLLIVDREKYSYFATITFYGGSRIAPSPGRDTFSYAYESIPETVYNYKNNYTTKAKISDHTVRSDDSNIDWYEEAEGEDPTNNELYGDTYFDNMRDLGKNPDFLRSFFPHNIRNAGSTRPSILTTYYNPSSGDHVGRNHVYVDYGMLHLGLRGRSASTYELGRTNQDVNPALPKVIFKGFKLNWKSNK